MHQLLADLTNSQECFGASRDVSGDVVLVTRCCYNTCWSRTDQMCISGVGSDSPKYFPNSRTPLLFLSVFMYPGTHIDGIGMLGPKGNISSSFPS
jgi:hypothetical protein